MTKARPNLVRASVALGLLGLGLVGLALADQPTRRLVEGTLQQYAEPWWRPRVPVHEPIPGTTGSMAADCATCHVEIAAEWRASIHAAAWTDVQFQKELAKDPEVGWLCINCHIPATGQQAELVEPVPGSPPRDARRTPNPDYDEQWQQEGITCLSCHWAEGAIAGPGRSTAAPHPVVISEPLRNGTICLSCHQADARIEDALVCHFTTGQEWEEAGRPAPCTECHMPQVVRPVALGAEARPTRRHTWPGSGIPKSDPAPEGFAEAMEGWVPGAAIRLGPLPEVGPGEQATATVVLSHQRAGHRVPSGDPERYLLVEVEVRTATGSIAGGRMRVGQRWIWWPVAQKLADDRLSPGEERRLQVPFVMPEDGATVYVSLAHYRISPENAAYHGLEGYPTHRVVQELEEPVRPSPTME